MLEQANNRIKRITSAISVSSNSSAGDHDLNNPQPFLNPPDSRDIFLIPNAGIYHSESKLIMIHKILWKKTMPEIAQYADYVTRGSCNESWMIKKFKTLSTQNAKDFTKKCTVDIGNIAYLALYCNDQQVRMSAVSLINNWKTYNQNNCLKFPHIGNIQATILLSIAAALTLLCWVIFK